MKITYKKGNIIFTPENDKDCFDLGHLSVKNKYALTVMENLTITEMKIPATEILKILLSRKTDALYR